jgi:hypothetical protein
MVLWGLWWGYDGVLTGCSMEDRGEILSPWGWGPNGL